MRAGHPEHVATAGPAQHLLDLTHSIDGVGGHPREWHVGGQRTFDDLHGDAWLGREAHVAWHVCAGQAGRIVGPGFG